MEKKIVSNNEEDQKKETQPNSDENINQPNTNENLSEKIEFSSIDIQKNEENDLMNVYYQLNANENLSEIIEFSSIGTQENEENDEENDLMNVDCDESNEEGGIYLLSDKICEEEKKNMLMLISFFLSIQMLLMTSLTTLIPRTLNDGRVADDINLKQKICEDENEVSKKFLGNKRSNVNFIKSKKNKCCKNSNSKKDNNYSNSNSNYIPLNENKNYDNSEYNNNNSNFLLFENQSSKNNHNDINFSSHSLEQNNIIQNLEFIPSKETHILQQNNIIQNLEFIPSKMKQNKNESSNDEVTKDTQPNSDKNINQPNTNENSSEKIEHSLNAIAINEDEGRYNLKNEKFYKLFNNNEKEMIFYLPDNIDNKNMMNWDDIILKQKKCEDENKISKNYFDNKNMINLDEINLKEKKCEDENKISKNYFDNKNMINLDEINLKQKICEDENKVSKNYLGNKRSNVNFVEGMKNKFCGVSNSEGDSCSNSNCIPLNENEGYDNSEYNNDSSNFLLFESRSSNGGNGDINISSHSLEEISEQNDVSQSSDLITSQETHNLQQNNINQNLQHSENNNSIDNLIDCDNLELNNNDYNEPEDNKLFPKDLNTKNYENSN